MEDREELVQAYIQQKLHSKKCLQSRQYLRETVICLIKTKWTLVFFFLLLMLLLKRTKMSLGERYVMLNSFTGSK